MFIYNLKFFYFEKKIMSELSQFINKIIKKYY